jgi:hypothetical protein
MADKSLLNRIKDIVAQQKAAGAEADIPYTSRKPKAQVSGLPEPKPIRKTISPSETAVLQMKADSIVSGVRRKK